MNRVAVLQSNYLPWKGYFDIIHNVDLFIFYDEVQFTKNDWRNRNLLIMNGEPRWLTVPVGDNINRRIIDVKMKDARWQRKHYNSLQIHYGGSPFWHKYKDFFSYVYLERRWEYLYEINRYIIIHIAKDFLGLNTQFADSRDYNSRGVRGEKLLSLLQDADTEVYVSGPAAKSYIDEEKYENVGIKIIWQDYNHYPVYPQHSKRFVHGVSIVDLLCNCGDRL